MRSNHPMASMAALVTPEREEVTNPGTSVPLTGVLNKGRGVLVRSSDEATPNAYPVLNRLRAGQVIYSKLKAFEGSVAVVSDDADGTLASPEFPTFRVTSAVLPAYLAAVFQHPDFWSSLAAASKGMGGRRERLHPRDFNQVCVPLPDIPVQRRIVDLLAAADLLVESLESEAAVAAGMRDSLLDQAVARSQATTELASLVEAPPKGFSAATAPRMFRYAALSDVKRDRQLLLSELPEHTFDSAPTRARLVVQPGDSVVPAVGIHNRGSLFVGMEHAGLVVSTGFCVFRPKAAVDPRLVWATVRSGQFIKWGKQHTRGTTLPAVGTKDLLRFAAPTSIAPAVLDAVSTADEVVVRAVARVAAATQLRDQLLHDLLSGSHTIPESYDRFLDGVTA